MRTTEEVLAYVHEQLWYTEMQAKDMGKKLPLLATLEIEPSQSMLEQKYWLYQALKLFIEGKI